MLALLDLKHNTKKKPFGRDIFFSGEYVQYFKPDESTNPFYKIYNKKRRDTVEIIEKLKLDCITILDIGGGMGRIAIHLAQLELGQVVLADISIEMIMLALEESKQFSNIKVVNTDAHDLPFNDQSFDIVVGLDLFCHLEQPVRALQEFHRVLRDCGTIILDSTNSNSLWALFYPRYLGKNPFNWLRIMKNKGVYPGWEKIVNHYSKREFFSLLGEGGFSILRTMNYGPALCPKWHLVIANKKV
ncbi:class I SAM-dependent methyltransferase [Acidobacteriota bacterium]